MAYLASEQTGRTGRAVDPRGKQLPNYLEQLHKHLLAEQDFSLKELGSLRQNVDHIKDIVAMQRSFASVSGLKEQVDLRQLIEKSVRVHRSALAEGAIEVLYACEALSPLWADRRKILQILVNLIRNAIHACRESGRSDRRMILRLSSCEGGAHGRIELSAIDDGVGIAAAKLTHIFQHGFTTRRAGHGFGLHSAVRAAKQLGGSLRAASEGVGPGATFS